MFERRKNNTLPWIMGSTAAAIAIGAATYALQKQRTGDEHQNSFNNKQSKDQNLPTEQHGEYQLSQTDQKHIEELQDNLFKGM
ncbi:hypothetical protein [Bacillus dakarensis]|uniref:hypothetical protein n=1 Tax=Robertmurraya dakarensis TaxID=1926278 RepID=UPI000981F86D|nr:hypothetical protein [Bacillus dakarensis]